MKEIITMSMIRIMAGIVGGILGVKMILYKRKK